MTSCLSSGLHHQSSSDGIKGETDRFRGRNDELGEEELLEERGFPLCFIITEDPTLSGIVSSEVEGSVDEDTDHRHSVSSVDTGQTLLFEVFRDTVRHTGKFSLGGILSDVGGQSRSGEVERVHDRQTNGSGQPTGHQIAEEVLQLLIIGVHSGDESSLEGVLHGEVYGGSGEIPDDVSPVTPPECQHSLLLEHSRETIDDTVILGGQLDISVLGLEQQFNSLNGGRDRLGNRTSHTTHQEIP